MALHERPDPNDNPYRKLLPGGANAEFDRLMAVYNAAGGNEPTDASLPQPVDWTELFARDRSAEDWLVPKLWPRGRMISLSAPVKARKSLLMLYLAACLAVGRDPWTGAKRDAVRVVYMDFEMTEDDIVERLEDMGFGADDLANLRYFLRPEIPHLDTPEGGKMLLAIIDEHDADALVIDTFSRVVKTVDWGGNEVREFYRWSAMHVKARGTAIARLDHVGHSEQNRAAGSVAKGADVDVGWVIHPGDGSTLTLEHHGMTRVRWVPPKIEMLMTDDPLTFRLAAQVYAPGTAGLAAVLDQLGVALDASVRTAQAALKAAGKGRRFGLVSDAIQYRRDHPETLWITREAPREAPCAADPGSTPGSTTPKNMHLPGTEALREAPGSTPADNWEAGGVTDREHPASSPSPDRSTCRSCGRPLTADGRCMDPTCKSNEPI